MMQDMDLASLPYLVELMTEHALQPGYDYAAEFDPAWDARFQVSSAIGQTEELGSFGVAAECMEACKARSGCKHFLFGWYALDRPSASP